jgi:hypothetical protein
MQAPLAELAKGACASMNGHFLAIARIAVFSSRQSGQAKK